MLYLAANLWTLTLFLMENLASKPTQPTVLVTHGILHVKKQHEGH